MPALAGLGGCLCAGACGTSPGVLFDPANREIGWPPPPDDARVLYVGQLKTDRDLKAGRSFAGNLGVMLFGREAEQEMVSPMGVCTDARGRVFVCDSGARVVHVFDLEEREYAQWAPPAEVGGFVLPVAATVGPDGELLVSDAAAGVVHIFDGEGAHVGVIGEGELARPVGMVVDAQTGRLYVADPGAHQIVVLSMAGDLVTRIGARGSAPGQFNFPTYVAMDRSGQLYVSDSLNFRVQVFDRAFNVVRTIGSKGDLPGYFAQPKGIAIDPDGHLYVVDANFEAVQLFDSTGPLLMTFGEEGRDAGQFWLPVGIHIDEQGRIWIADSYNRRVQAFEYVREASP